VYSSTGIASGNTLEAVAAAFFINNFANGRNAFDRAADVLKYVALAGLFSTAISPTLGVTSLALCGLRSLGALRAGMGDLGGWGMRGAISSRPHSFSCDDATPGKNGNRTKIFENLLSSGLSHLSQVSCI